MTQLTSIARFERFFRAAAGLNVDKSDLKRYTDFVNQKTYDLLLIGQAHAKANARSLIEPRSASISFAKWTRPSNFSRSSTTSRGCRPSI